MPAVGTAKLVLFAALAVVTVVFVVAWVRALRRDRTGRAVAPTPLEMAVRYVYVHGPGIDEPLVEDRFQAGGTFFGTSFFHVDGLGSFVRRSGTPYGPISLQYSAFGVLEGSSSKDFAFTGREWDIEMGLYYYRARYYDPKLGRFISEDPIGFSGGINFYSYVGNRPTILTDAFGLRANPVGCIQATGRGFGLMELVIRRKMPPGRDEDKRAHCLAFCEMSKGCGPFLGGMVFNVGIGFSKEVVDSICYYGPRAEVRLHFQVELPCTTPADLRDIDANMWGASCPVEQDCESRCADAPSRFQ